MKKIIMAFSIVLLISCSEDTNQKTGFFMPSWISGSWKRIGTSDILTFTQNDIILNNVYSFNQFHNSMPGSIQVISNTSTTYILDVFQTKGSPPIRFVFIKKNKLMESRGYLPGTYTKRL